MNFLNKMNFTCIVIIIIIAMATLHLYNIKNVDKFEDIAVEDNQIVSADVNILIPSMNQVVFNGKQLNTIMDEKVSKTELNDAISEKVSKTELNNAMPELSIISYAGSTAPTGWQLCNGNLLEYSNSNNRPVHINDIRTINFNEANGFRKTPDLRGRFILGNGGSGANKALHNNGGEETHTLTVNEMPAHDHKILSQHSSNSHHNVGYRSASHHAPGYWAISGNNHEADSYRTNYVGGNAPHNNMPPYYVLTYIIKQPSPPSS